MQAAPFSDSYWDWCAPMIGLCAGSVAGELISAPLLFLSNLGGAVQLSGSGVIVFAVFHDLEFIVRTCPEVLYLDG